MKFTKQNGIHQAKYNLEGDLIWRHVAVVYDETTDNFRLYYDGSLAYEGWHGSNIRKSDCVGPGEEWTFGHDKGSFDSLLTARTMLSDST